MHIKSEYLQTRNYLKFNERVLGVGFMFNSTTGSSKIEISKVT